MPSDLNENGLPHRACGAGKALATRISREAAKTGHCAIYEVELQDIWPLDEEDRKENIERFARRYGLKLSFYKKGLCAIFKES